MRKLKIKKASQSSTSSPSALLSLGFAFQAMSSVCEIRLDATHSQTEAALTAAAKLAIAEVGRIEQKYSRYRADSIVSRINTAAGLGVAVEVDSETAALLDFAQSLHTLSDGLFDITSGVLRQAWDFKAQIVPTQAKLAALLPLIGWNKVEWRGNAIKLPSNGMEIDFGGFGKEYAADRAMAVLAASGMQHGFINLGGDIRILGPRTNGAPWRFGIAHPRADDLLARAGADAGGSRADALGSRISKVPTQTPPLNEPVTIAYIDLHNGALASSGDYERYFIQNGHRYCHILNPTTGAPVTNFASVSVAAPACIAAGALSTIAMLKGAQATDFLNTQGISFLAFTGNLQVIQSSEFNATRFTVEGALR